MPPAQLSGPGTVPPDHSGSPAIVEAPISLPHPADAYQPGGGARSASEAPPAREAPLQERSNDHPRGKLTRLDAGEPLGLRRGDCVVCIPVCGADEFVLECLRSVLRNTPHGVTVCVVDDAGPDDGAWRLLDELDVRGLLDLAVVFIRQPHRVGYVESVNSVFDAAAPADVLLLDSDCVVAKGWFDGLRDAAYSDTTVATATALTNHGALLSLPERNHPTYDLPYGWTLDAAAARIRATALGLRPTVPTAVGHCTYVRRAALDLVGCFDPAFSPRYGEEVDFSQRCVRNGLRNVAADDVFVLHHARDVSVPDAPRDRLRADHEAILKSRYPYYALEVRRAARSTSSPLALALGVARRALTGLSVTIDGSCLGPLVMGTQIHALGVIQAMARRDDIRLRVTIPPDCGPHARDLLNRLSGVEILVLDKVNDQTPQSDIVHCPQQVSSAEHLRTLRRLGERLVISQLDLIAYHNPSYHASHEAWEGYRRTTRLSLRTADRVVFISQHSAEDALGEGLVDSSYARVVHPGTDHGALSQRPPPVAPARASADLGDGDVILCLGADYHHKNRVFILRVLRELQRRHGWDGRLVLAGVRVQHGSSVNEEAGFLLVNPEVDAATVRLASVSEAEKAWLMQRSLLVMYPSACEGFGFVPFEAAEAGVPTMFAPQASLAEVAPASSAMIVPWDAAATADRAIELLRDGELRRAAVDELTSAAQSYCWHQTVEELVEIYAETARSAPRGEPIIAEPQVTELGLCLVGADGALDLGTQEMLWALARRPVVARVLFGLPTSVYRRLRGALWHFAAYQARLPRPSGADDGRPPARERRGRRD